MYILYDIIMYILYPYTRPPPKKKKHQQPRKNFKVRCGGNRFQKPALGGVFWEEHQRPMGGCRLYWCFKDVKVDVSTSSTTKH